MAASKQKKKYDPVKALLDNLPPPEGEAGDWWEKNLELNEKNRILASLRNAFLILTRDDRWAGVLGFDEFANRVVKRKPPPFDAGKAGEWGEVDDIRTMLWLAHHYRVNMEPKTLLRAVVGAANEARFHPVREYLSGLKWDGRPRAQSWLSEYLGAAADEYSRLAGTKFLIMAIARVMEPGVKADNVLILEGPQGRWKSTALSVLAGDWFMDTPFTMGDKDAYLVICGSWIVELAELDGFSRVESSRAKSFFSSRIDTYVPKWVAWATRVKRQCVFVGTVNHGTYLRDTTGNRRYWPVKIQRADIDRLRADRDQIWAEALALYRQRTRWWVDSEELELFRLEQELREIGDAFEDVIRTGLTNSAEVTMDYVLSEILHLEKAKWSRAEQTRVGEVLHALGWERRRRANGSRGYFYARREREPGEDE